MSDRAQAPGRCLSTRRWLRLLLPPALLVLCALGAAAQQQQIRQVGDAAEVFREMMAIPDKSVPEFLLQEAYGIGIVPGVLKVGFVIGGRYGRGVLLVRQQGGGWSAPVFVTLSGGSVGWQVGVQSTDLVLVFRTRHSVDGALKGNFTIGVDVSAAAGPVGRQAGASTDAELKAEIYSYSRSRGFFAGIALDGAVLQVDDAADSAFYGVPDIAPQDIVEGRLPAVPPAAAALRAELDNRIPAAGH